MAIPDYADERAHKYFYRGFVGSGHGENGTGYRLSWSSTSDAKPTSVHRVDSNHSYCVFCGNRAFPIQNEHYAVTGYSCICKDAMDELEWQFEYQILLNEQYQAREALKKKAPVPKKEALLSVVSRKVEEINRYIERDFHVTHELKRLGIDTIHPFDRNED